MDAFIRDTTHRLSANLFLLLEWAAPLGYFHLETLCTHHKYQPAPVLGLVALSGDTVHRLSTNLVLLLGWVTLQVGEACFLEEALTVDKDRFAASIVI